MSENEFQGKKVGAFPHLLLLLSDLCLPMRGYTTIIFPLNVEGKLSQCILGPGDDIPSVAMV